MLRGILGRFMGGRRGTRPSGTRRPARGTAGGNAGVERGARSLLRGLGRRRRL